MSLALMMSVAACSGDDSKKDDATLPDQVVPLADLVSKKVKSAGSVHVEATQKAADGNPQAQGTLNGRFRTSTPATTAQMTIVDQDPKDRSTTEVVLSDGIVYSRTEGDDAAPGKPWLKLTRQDVSKPDLGPFGQVFVVLLDRVERTAKEVGADPGMALVRNGTLKSAPADEKLGGAATRKYTGTTQISKLSSDPSFAALAKLGATEIPWTLWVGKNGLPHQFQSTVPGPEGAKLVNTATHRDWGKPAQIQVPPSNQVATIEEAGK